MSGKISGGPWRPLPPFAGKFPFFFLYSLQYPSDKFVLNFIFSRYSWLPNFALKKLLLVFLKIV